MLVYSAGSVEVERLERMADDSGQNNFLFTFANPAARKCARHFSLQPHRKLIVDSGAFTVWNQDDEPISLEHYISFCKELTQSAKCPVTFMSLDVIPGSKTDGPTPDQSAAACQEGWDNYKTMRAAGVNAVPTFHEFDDFDWLFQMLNHTDHIAVSPRKSGVSREQKLEWLGKLFSAVGIDTKVHGLGIANSEAVESFPFYSVDNRAWLQGKNGDFRFFDGRRIEALTQEDWRNPSGEKRWDDGTDAVAEAQKHYCPPGTSDGNFYFMMRALHADARLQHFLNLLWQRRGFDPGESLDTGSAYHLDLSDTLYKDAVASGSWRKVAEVRGVDPEYVQWAVNLARETAEWQSYVRGEIPLELLSDRLAWGMWDGQLSTRELYLPRPSK